MHDLWHPMRMTPIHLRSIAESSQLSRETQLLADNISFSLSPVVVTDGAPYAVVVDLNSTSCVISTRQTYRVRIERDVWMWKERGGCVRRMWRDVWKRKLTHIFTHLQTHTPSHLTPATKAHLYKWQRHLEYDHSWCCPSCYGYTEKYCSQSHYIVHCPAISVLRRRGKEGGRGRWERGRKMGEN